MAFDLSKASILVKTLKGYGRVVAQIIKENFPDAEVLPDPLGFFGLILVKSGLDEKLAEEIKRKIPEAEKVFPLRKHVKADLEAILNASSEFFEEIKKASSFAVRTVRRGKHDFRSIDVNINVGALIQEATGCEVNLDFPEKVVEIEIIGPHAYLSIVDGKEFWSKESPLKRSVRKYFKRISIVQMPYLENKNICREIGNRVGREVQTFEVGRLIITPIGAVRAEELNFFLKGIFKGIESRYQIQTKTYATKPHKTDVYVQNLYEFVRERREPMVVFEPEGKPIDLVSSELANLILKNKRVNFLIGSREGIPKGIFRFANFVLDLCPGVTISTDLAAASALVTLAFAIHKKLTK